MTDSGALIRSKAYRRLLVFAGLLGVLVSVACWGFLELIHWLQESVYVDLPNALGFADLPSWWPLPVLAVAGARDPTATSKIDMNRLPRSDS